MSGQSFEQDCDAAKAMLSPGLGLISKRFEAVVVGYVLTDALARAVVAAGLSDIEASQSLLDCVAHYREKTKGAQ